MLFTRVLSPAYCPILSGIKPAVLFSNPVRNFPKKQKMMTFWPSDWLPFEWDWPPRVMGYFKTGDPDEKLQQMKDFKNTYKPGFEFLQDRHDVPEEVKKLFKMDNSFRLELNNYIRAERNRRYQRHPFDNESLEVRIANYTSQIRQLKQVIYDLPNNVMCKIYVSLYKDKRTKCLNELYRMDAARYHAIVKDLNIDHVLGMPGVDTYMKDQRKRSLRRLTDAYCHNMKKGKLEAYHEKLKAQQEPFLKEAEEANKWIEQEMAKYHISEEDLETGFKPRKRYRDPHPVRPLVQELSQ